MLPADPDPPPRSSSQSRFIAWLILGLGAGLILLRFLSRHAEPARDTVVAYIAQDQVFAEPILADFTRETGLRVRTVFDSEAVKTVALANRLMAERKQPQCDVFWGNEELRTRQLEAQGVFEQPGSPQGWAPVGHRSRRLVINTRRLGPTNAPASLLDLTNAVWRGRVALAYPLFGTTATHFLALRQRWGAAAWEHWCRALRANQPFLVDGNSVVVQFVARGEAWVGLTDSDDIEAARREGAPVAALPLTPESLLIPNTVALVRGAPHPEPARRLFEHLLRTETTRRLVDLHALEDTKTPSATSPTLQPDWPRLLQELVPATETLRQVFLR